LLFLGSPLGLQPSRLFLVSPLSLQPSRLFLGSPFGFQPAGLFLGLLPDGFFSSLALFRRNPWLIQRFDHFLTEALDLLSDGSRLNIEMTQGTPIDVLTASNDRENRIISPFGLALERTNRNVKNWKNEVISTDFFFSGEKRFKFKFAVFAADRPRCDYRNEKKKTHQLLS